MKANDLNISLRQLVNTCEQFGTEEISAILVILLCTSDQPCLVDSGVLSFYVRIYYNMPILSGSKHTLNRPCLTKSVIYSNIN